MHRKPSLWASTADATGHELQRAEVRPINISSSPVLSFARGFSLHAATRIDADDRAGLERLDR